MPVQLDENDRPVSWGKNVVGEEIPDPPQELVRAKNKCPKWDREQKEWVEDPDYTPDVRKVDRDLISGDTKREILEARENGNLQAQVDHILDVLDVIDLGDEDDGTD